MLWVYPPDKYCFMLDKVLRKYDDLTSAHTATLAIAPLKQSTPTYTSASYDITFSSQTT